MRVMFAAGPLAIVCGVVALAGCSSQPAAVDQTLRCTPAVASAAPTGPAWVTRGYGTGAEPIPLNAVLFTSNAVAERVAVQSITSQRTPGGTVQVTARLLNCGDQAAMVRARISFLTRAGAPAEAMSAWQPLPLPGKASALYAETSLRSDDIEAFLIEVGPLP